MLLQLCDYLGDAKPTTTTHSAYAGVPLADHSAPARAKVLEGVVKRVLEARAGEPATDPPAGVTAAGTKRGRTSAPYDFLLCGRRIKVKAAQLSWGKQQHRWQAQWVNIKADAHDDLFVRLQLAAAAFLNNLPGPRFVPTAEKVQQLPHVPWS